MIEDMYPGTIMISMPQVGSVLGTADDPHGSPLTMEGSGVISVEAAFVPYLYPQILGRTVEAGLASRTYISSALSAAILDPNFIKLWHPLLDNLPVLNLQRVLRVFRKFLSIIRLTMNAD